MQQQAMPRRKLLSAHAALMTAGASASLADPSKAAAQAAGVKPVDLPDLTIKEIKVWFSAGSASPPS